MSDITVHMHTDTTASGQHTEKRRKSFRQHRDFIRRRMNDRRKQRRRRALAQREEPSAFGAFKDNKPSCDAAQSSKISSPAHKPSLSDTVMNNGFHETPTDLQSSESTSTAACGSQKQNKTKASPTVWPSKYVAIDCEMVGAGPKGSISQVARCSMVNYNGDVLYDSFIKPSMPVTDYRTRWSGIRSRDLLNAPPFAQARKEILKMLMGKVVVGHAVHNDFKVLHYCHPPALTRDTSRIPLLNQKAGFPERECASLKRLTKAIFNKDIQSNRGGHSSVEDAKATMELYKVVESEWEKELALKSQAS